MTPLRNGLLRRRGLTLVEVVAASVLAALLMVQVLKVMQEHRRQVRQAETKTAAVREAERLLSGWYAGTSGPPRQAQGTLAQAELTWKTELVRRPIDDGLDSEILRLTLRSVGAENDGPPATTFELLVPRVRGTGAVAP